MTSYEQIDHLKAVIFAVLEKMPNPGPMRREVRRNIEKVILEHDEYTVDDAVEQYLSLIVIVGNALEALMGPLAPAMFSYGAQQVIADLAAEYDIKVPDWDPDGEVV